MREDFRTVTPYLTTTEGDRLVDFLKKAFDAEETHRTQTPKGFHTEVKIGDSMLMIGWTEMVRGNEWTGAFHVYVPDCDAAYQRALEAGGESLRQPQDQDYGERSATVRDFQGNRWYIATMLPGAEHQPAATLMPYLHPKKVRPYIDFLKRAWGAEELGVYEQAGRVMHAAVKIGDSVIEMGEADPTPAHLFLYVNDFNFWYRRAVEAGARVVEEPTDKPYGRTATLADDWGVEWMPTVEAIG